MVAAQGQVAKKQASSQTIGVQQDQQRQAQVEQAQAILFHTFPLLLFLHPQQRRDQRPSPP
ncbi:MAG: hypothetical protein ACKO5P_04280 [Nodosilinea sp.]